MCAILLESLVLFTACLALHVAIWRIRRPTAFSQWLPALTIVFFVVGPGVAWWIEPAAFPGAEAGRGRSLTDWLAVMLLHGSLSAVYIIGYTLISAFSPSVEILKLLDRTPAGLAEADMDLPFLALALSGDRVGNLVAGGLIRTDGQDVRLSPGARALTVLVLSYRHFIGLPDGAGG